MYSKMGQRVQKAIFILMKTAILLITVEKFDTKQNELKHLIYAGFQQRCFLLS